MRNFKTVKHAQKFLTNHGLINNHFRHQRHLAKASTYRLLREESFNTWTQTSCAQSLVIA
jgi:putative transposase